MSLLDYDGLLSAIRRMPNTMGDHEAAAADAFRMGAGLLGGIYAKPTGFPNGGWYPVDEAGQIIRHPALKYGEMPKRFQSPEVAVKAAEKWMRQISKQQKP